MKLNTSLLTIELPVNFGLTIIPLGFQGRYFLFQSSFITDPPRQTLPLKPTDLDFSHIQPASVFGRVVKLQLPRQPPRLGWLEGRIQRGGFMGVQVILNHPDHFRFRISFIHQPLDEMGVILAGAPLRYCHVPVTRLGLDHYKQIAAAISFVLVVLPGRLLRPGWYWLSDLAMQLFELFVQADLGTSRVVRFGLQIEDIFHPRHEGWVYFRDTPLLFLPGFELVFFRVWRIVSYEMVSTSPNSTVLAANIRKVHWP